MNSKNLTFSGTDTIAFIILPNTPPIALGSLTTLSYSSYRVKNPVNTLGGIHIKGVAKGGRVIAGTLIFTMINQHWVKELCSTVPWLSDATNGIVYSDELPLFDIMVVSANEYGKYVSMMIYGIDLTDEAQVLSVNDMYSENTFSFIAREIKPFSNHVVTEKDKLYTSNRFYTEIKFDLIDTTTSSSSITTNGSFAAGNNNSNNNILYDEYIHDAQNKLEDLGYNITQNGYLDTPTKDAIYDIMDKIGYDQNDFDFFYKFLLPDLDYNYINNNNYYANESITTYLGPPIDDETKTEYAFGSYSTNEKVIVLYDLNVNDKTYYYTTKGWVEADNVLLYTNETSILDVKYNGESILNNLNKVIKTTDSIKEFCEKFVIELNSSSTQYYITNASIRASNNITSNSVKKLLIDGRTHVMFTDRINHIQENYFPGAIVDFIISGVSKNDNMIISVIFDKGEI